MRTQLLVWMTLVLTAVQPLCASVWEKVLLVAHVEGESVAKAGSRNVTSDQICRLYAVLEGHKEGRTLYTGEVPSGRFGGRTVAPLPPPQDFDIRWYKVEPLMYHADGRGHDPANPDFLWYTNAGAPGGRTDRRPLSPDRIRYRETELEAQRGRWSIVTDGRPTDPEYDRNGGLGTMRYAVRIRAPEGQEWRSPSVESYRNNGIGDDVWRITVRRGNDYLGYLTGFFNVPGVFGSYPEQVNRYVGVDCADLVVGAWNHYRRVSIPYTNVTGLRYAFPRQGHMRLVVSDRYLFKGKTFRGWSAQTSQTTEPEDIRIGADGIQLGDVIVVNYNPDLADRSWDHVGVLYEDKGPDGRANGILDDADRLFHSGPAEPRLDPLSAPGFSGNPLPIRIAVLRWVS